MSQTLKIWKKKSIRRDNIMVNEFNIIMFDLLQYELNIQLNLLLQIFLIHFLIVN